MVRPRQICFHRQLFFLQFIILEKIQVNSYKIVWIINYKVTKWLSDRKRVNWRALATAIVVTESLYEYKTENICSIHYLFHNIFKTALLRIFICFSLFFKARYTNIKIYFSYKTNSYFFVFTKVCANKLLFLRSITYRLFIF